MTEKNATFVMRNLKTGTAKDMVRIFLIGYMGAGKTTLGSALAQAAGLSFIDLDWRIEGRFHKSVNAVFAERGEDGFRLLERSMLHEVAEFEDVVVSVGGGTPCFFDNMEFMNRKGETVFLNAGLDALFRRLKAAKHSRPLLRGKPDDELRDFIRAGVEERMRWYSMAKHEICSDELETREQIGRTVELFRQLLGI